MFLVVLPNGETVLVLHMHRQMISRGEYMITYYTSQNMISRGEEMITFYKSKATPYEEESLVAYSTLMIGLASYLRLPKLLLVSKK